MPITIKEGLPLEGESLCATCVFAHIQRLLQPRTVSSRALQSA